jgi:hypothetical protein
MLLQNADDLFVCKTVALHSLVLSMGQSLLQNGLFQRGKVTGGKQVNDIDGGVSTDISNETPFECIIVCELTLATRILFESSLAQNPTPDRQGYYGWSKAHNATIQVIFFFKMLRDAELRNRTFFDQLKPDAKTGQWPA